MSTTYACPVTITETRQVVIRVKADSRDDAADAAKDFVRRQTENAKTLSVQVRCEVDCYSVDTKPTVGGRVDVVV